MIDDYLDSLAAALSFDRALARRVGEEIEDHLHAAAAADSARDRRAAEAHAISACGNPHALAAEFALVTLAKRSRRLGVSVIVMAAAVLAAMEARSAWYAATQWVIGDGVRPVIALVGPIDRYAFLISIVAALSALVYVGGRSVPAVFDVRYHTYLRRLRLLCTAAAVTLALSVITDAVLTSLRLATTDPSWAFFIPILLVAFEIACAGALVVLIRDLARRTASAAALPQD
jgi:hypothetical protein